MGATTEEQSEGRAPVPASPGRLRAVVHRIRPAMWSLAALSLAAVLLLTVDAAVDRLVVAAMTFALTGAFVASQARRREAMRELVRFRAQADSLRRYHPDLVFTTDPDGRFLDVGDALAALLGVAPDDLLGTTSLDHVAERDRRDVLARHERVLAGEATSGDVVIVDSAGRERTVELTLSPVRERERVVGVWGIGKDVTEERATRRELEDLRQVLEMMDDAVFVYDPDTTRIRYVNGGAVRLYGWLREELVGRLPDEFWPQCTPELIRELTPPEGEPAWHAEYELRAADGGTRWVDAHLQRIGGLIVGVDRDLSEHRAIAEQLAASERRFRELAENVSEGLYRMTYKPEVAYEYANPAVEEILGYPPEALVRDPGLTMTITHPDDRHLLEEARTKGELLGGGHAVVRIRHRDGRWRHVRIREQLIPGSSGEASGVLGVLVDVTDDRSREEALQRALATEQQAVVELERIDAIRESFLQALSHELRTPLTSILGFAQLLQRRADELAPERRATMYERLASNAEKLDGLLADLLDVDRLQRGASVIDPRVTDVASLVARVVAGFHARDRVVTPRLEPALSAVDPPKLERVVENLLANAVRHTPEGTAVHVRVGVEDGGIRLEVEDEGIGVPDELKARMFEPFEQGHDARGEPSPGTGIGLALVRQIVELHGGRVWVEDGRRGGARFCVRLPAADAHADRGADDEPRAVGA